MSLNIKKPQRDRTSREYDAVVVGAGPYGLSTAAHLRERGLRVAIFGKPLSLWRDNMPEEMLLRSFWWATSLSDPQKKYGMARYFAEHNLTAPYPLARETFVDYGLWFQRHVVPDVDETYIASIEHTENQFMLTLEDGRCVQSRAVVMAPGLRYYTYTPTEYDRLSPELVSHTSTHVSSDPFVGKKVIVVGGGQSALESAAILHERGASVEVISRSPLRWLIEVDIEKRSLLQRLRSPKAGIAPGWFNWGLENFPYSFQRLPQTTKDRLLRGRGSYGPAGSAWLKPRLLGKVNLREGQAIQHVAETDHGVAVTLASGEKVHADHILLATGYRVNVRNLPMLPPSLLSSIHTYQNAPRLNGQFESNIPGLYFVGISALLSCGPLFRFVVGTDAAARRVAWSVAQKTLRQ